MDKEFDYIIASYIAEHIDDHVEFCKELIRVGKRGYIETPSKFVELILGGVLHKWYVYIRKGTLIFEKIKKRYLFGIFSRFFYAIFYLNIKRESKPIFYFHNRGFRGLSNRLIYCFLRQPWMMFKKVTYTCFEWEERFNYKIIDKNE